MIPESVKRLSEDRVPRAPSRFASMWVFFKALPMWREQIVKFAAISPPHGNADAMVRA
jgi:hypothetical protein